MRTAQLSSPTTAARGPAAATSSVQKACRILRAMADPRNARLTEIALAAGLDKATTLRLLDALARDGFVLRDVATKRYALGPELLVLGAAQQARFDLRPIARPSLVRLAAVLEDTAILSVPSGAESVCIDLQLGSFPIRANYLEVGSRRPLGVGAGSLALLAWMPDSEIEAILPLVTARLGRYPRITPRLLEKQIAASRERGYAVLVDVVVDRMGGIAMHIPGPDGRPAGALSIAALTERITRREDELAAALKREVAACTALANGAPARNGLKWSRSHSISPRPRAKGKP